MVKKILPYLLVISVAFSSFAAFASQGAPSQIFNFKKQWLFYFFINLLVHKIVEMLVYCQHHGAAAFSTYDEAQLQLMWHWLIETT